MATAGLVSISFRSICPEELIAAAREAGLAAIEWGGDVHSPHGDVARAKEIAAATRAAGLTMPEYGSYYIIGKSEHSLFSEVVKSAKALGTHVIRVWPCMNMPSDTLSAEDYDRCVKDAQRICDEAADMTVALECHPGGLTDEYHTALAFIADVGRDNLKMMWQPNQHRPLEYNLDAIRALYPYIVGVHVFFWKRKERFPLKDGESDWKRYIELLRGKDIPFMLEFMHDNNIKTLKETAGTLLKWLKEA